MVLIGVLSPWPVQCARSALSVPHRNTYTFFTLAPSLPRVGVNTWQFITSPPSPPPPPSSQPSNGPIRAKHATSCDIATSRDVKLLPEWLSAAKLKTNSWTIKTCRLCNMCVAVHTVTCNKDYKACKWAVVGLTKAYTALPKIWA